MATTTTNFGWDIPQSTDLVKDGATAIAALGQDIDTAMVDLKGGTTGQVLAKASGTDLDFSWVAQDDSNAIQNAIVDAKGDLIAATAADTPARLAVGTNGQILTADSTAATGLAWASPASAASYTLINTGGTTLSGNTTVSSIGGYTHLFFVIEGACASGGSGTDYFVRFNGDTGANYAWGSVGSFNSATANSCGFDKAATSVKLGFRYGTTTNFNNGNYSAGWVYRYGSADDKMFDVDTWGTDGAPNTTPFFNHVRGAYNGTSAITSMSVNADNSLTGGKIYVYGVN
jgi:hypothetical protein